VPLTVAVPVGPTLVKVTAQLPDVKRQLAPTVPIAAFDDVKLTVPVGVFAGVVVSVTVAVHVEVAPGIMVFGLQATAVDVLSSGAWLENVAVWMFSGSKLPPGLAIQTQVSPAGLELLEPAQAPSPVGVVTT